MKSFENIYFGIRNKFFKKSNADIARGSIIDIIFYAIADAIKTIYDTIEANKNPYLFTKQKGEELDSTGYFIQCPRLQNESDSNYFYRMQKWPQRNASCNLTAIDDMLFSLEHSSSGKYVPYTKGVGTATVYLIPKTYDDRGPELAINECKQKLSTVINPSSYVDYIVPDFIQVRLVAYLDLKDNSDIELIKQNILRDIKTYINSIPPGEKLMLGELNRIALKEPGVEYFNVVQLYLNNEENTAFEILQTLDKKFIFNKIDWWEAKE